MPSRFRSALPALLLCALVLTAFWPGLTGGFLFDDYSAIVENSGVHAASLDPRALWHAALSFEPGGIGRPVAMATFAVNHAVGGLDPWGYKLGGLLVHLGNALLVMLLSRAVLRLSGVPRETLTWAAAAIAAAWAVHPLQVSTVLYVVQRMETLSLSFVLIALLAYLRGREAQIEGRGGWAWLLFSLLAAAAGLLSKESAVLFPAYALALEFTLFLFKGSPKISQMLRVGYLAAAVVGGLVFALYVIPQYWSNELVMSRNYDSGQRLLTQLRVLPMYIGQIMLPLPKLMPFYYEGFPISKGLLSPWTTLAGGLAVVTLLFGAWWLRLRAPLAALGIFWFFSAHALTSNVIPLEIAFEHRNYFALLGVVFVIVEGIRRIASPDGPALKRFGIAALLFGLAGLCMIRSATWGDRLLLAMDLVDKNPASARATHDLGVQYFEMAGGRLDSPFGSMAEQQFEREAMLPASSILGEQALILMAARAERPAKSAWWDSLDRKLRLNPITPDDTHALFALLDNRLKGRLIDDRRLSNAFVLLFERAALPPNTYLQVGGHALDQLRDETRATWFFQRAIAVDGATPSFVQEVTRVLERNGHPKQAMEVRLYATALRAELAER